MEKRLLRKLFASIKCGYCGQSFGKGDIEVLGNKEDMWFLRVYCPSCHSQCLAAAIINQGKSTGLISDLTEEEIGKFADMDAVGSDDVLSMHDFLKDFDGDFSCLFGGRKT